MRAALRPAGAARHSGHPSRGSPRADRRRHCGARSASATSAEEVALLQRAAGNAAIAPLLAARAAAHTTHLPIEVVQRAAREPRALESQERPTVQRGDPDAPSTAANDKPHEPSMLAKILESAFKSLRTAMIVVHLAHNRALVDAQKAVSSASGELRGLKRQARALRNRIERSGGGAKVAAKLKEVEAEIAKVQQLITEERKVISAAESAMKAEQAAAKGLAARIWQLLGNQGVAKNPSKVWRYVGTYISPRINALVKLLGATTGGAKLLAALGRLRAPWVSRTLIGAAAVMEGVSAYLTTKNRTTGGKVADAVLTGASNALVVAHPGAALADLLLPEQLKLSKMYRGGSGAITAIGEGVVTGDTRAMDDFPEASKEGEYGSVMQASSEAGDFWAEHGVIDGIQEFGRELYNWL